MVRRRRRRRRHRHHQSTDNTMRVQIPDYVLCNVADNNTAATADVRTIWYEWVTLTDQSHHFVLKTSTRMCMYVLYVTLYTHIYILYTTIRNAPLLSLSLCLSCLRVRIYRHDDDMMNTWREEDKKTTIQLRALMFKYYIFGIEWPASKQWWCTSLIHIFSQ